MPGWDISQERWNEIFGAVDETKFTEEQRYELSEGQHLNLPVQLYAIPSLSSEQMKDLRTMLETAIEAAAHPELRLVCTEYGPQEVDYFFKSWTNFEKHPERVCYVPENWDFEEDGPGYTGRDILELCDQDPIKARMVFSLCDWQHPSTILDEWDMDDERDLQDLHKKYAEEEDGEPTQVPILPNSLVLQFQSQLGTIGTHLARLNDPWMRHGSYLTGLTTLLSSFNSFLQGASAALEGKCQLIYHDDENIVKVNDPSGRELGHISKDGFIPNDPQQSKQRPTLDAQMQSAKKKAGESKHAQEEKTKDTSGLERS